MSQVQVKTLHGTCWMDPGEAQEVQYLNRWATSVAKRMASTAPGRFQDYVLFARLQDDTEITEVQAWWMSREEARQIFHESHEKDLANGRSGAVSIVRDLDLDRPLGTIWVFIHSFTLGYGRMFCPLVMISTHGGDC